MMWTSLSRRDPASILTRKMKAVSIPLLCLIPACSAAPSIVRVENRSACDLPRVTCSIELLQPRVGELAGHSGSAALPSGRCFAVRHPGRGPAVVTVHIDWAAHEPPQTIRFENVPADDGLSIEIGEARSVTVQPPR